MGFKETLEEMFEKDIYGETEFDKIIKNAKGFEKKRAKHDYKMVGQFIEYDLNGKAHLKPGMQIPLMTCLQSREVMRDIISYNMI